MPSWSAVTADWTAELGMAFQALFDGGFIKSGTALADGHPCKRKPPCGCHHVRAPGTLRMVCDCEEPDCGDFTATEAQLRIHSLNTVRLADAIRTALSVKKPARLMPEFNGVFSLGTYLAPSQTTYPVYLILPTFEDSHHADLARLAATVGKRFAAVLLTREALDPRLETAMASKVLFVVLAETATIDEGGTIRLQTQVHDPLRAIDVAAPLELSEEEIARTIQMAFAMDDEKSRRSGPTMVQYLKSVARRMSRSEIAKKYSCSPTQISGLKREFKSRFKRDPEVLLGRISEVDQVAKTISDSRARDIHQRSATTGRED